MATNMFINFGSGISGEAEAKDHRDWCEIVDLKHEFSQSASPLMQPPPEIKKLITHKKVEVVKYIDNATTSILTILWKGKLLPEVIIKVFRADGNNPPVDYFTIKLNNVVISKYSFDYNQGELPKETIELDYAAVEYNYRAIDKDTGRAKGLRTAYHDRDENVVEAQRST